MPGPLTQQDALVWIEDAQDRASAREIVFEKTRAEQASLSAEQIAALIRKKTGRSVLPSHIPSLLEPDLAAGLIRQVGPALYGCNQAMIRCSACAGGWLVPRTLETYDVSSLVGLDGVMLVHAPALACDACGATTLEIGVLDCAMAALPALVISQGEELVPSEVRFLRETLGMTQSELADRLGVHRTMVARWETGDAPIARAQSIALRALATTG